MSIPKDISHRPNPNRAVTIYARLASEFAARLHNDMSTLMRKSIDPITIYIESRGGTISSLKTIEGLFVSKIPKQEVHQFITVATGEVRSAAANLLVMGNYAYAQKGIRLVFHGARYNIIRLPGPIKQADVLAMYIALDKENRRIAGKLSETMIYRVVHRFLDFQNRSSSRNYTEPSAATSFLDSFANYIHSHLSTDRSKMLLKESLVLAKTLSSNHFQLNPQQTQHRRVAISQAEMLNAVIARKLNEHAGSKWKIDDSVMVEIMNEYLLWQTSLSVYRQPTFQHVAKIFGHNLLTNTELAEYRRLKRKDIQGADGFLIEVVETKLSMLFCFTVALSQRLMIRENPVFAADAYWFGLVDEVLDSDLTFKPIRNEQRKQGCRLTPN